MEGLNDAGWDVSHGHHDAWKRDTDMLGFRQDRDRTFNPPFEAFMTASVPPYISTNSLRSWLLACLSPQRGGMRGCDVREVPCLDDPLSQHGTLRWSARPPLLLPPDPRVAVPDFKVAASARKKTSISLRRQRRGGESRNTATGFIDTT